MEKFKGTPGPWSLNPNGGLPCKDDTYWSIVIGKKEITGFINRHDAKLIMSAPDLLEALILMVDVFQNSNIEQQEAKVFAITAINKALNIKP